MIQCFFILGCVLGFAACGDNVASLAYAEYRAEESRVRCERLTRCGLFSDNAVCAGFFRTVPDPSFEASIAESKISYDGVAARNCIAALSQQTCDATSEEARRGPEACDRIFAGSSSAGEGCVYGAGCQSGVCNKPSCEHNECCPGVCESRRDAPLGGACLADHDCAQPGFCGADKTCASLLGAGHDCRSDLECDYGLACTGGGLIGTCRALAHAAEPCPFQRCADIGLTCMNGSCVAVGLPGDPCGSNVNCSPYAECDVAAGTCVNVPGLGMPCTTQCAGEAWCQPGIPAGTCVAPLANGEFCGATNQCASFTCPEDVVQRCTDATLCF